MCELLSVVAVDTLVDALRLSLEACTRRPKL
jgi:hypothetical protein